MCLYIDALKTERELCNEETRTFFKLFIKESDYLKTPYMSFIIRVPGQIILPNPEKQDSSYIIEKGAFHARTSEISLKIDIFFSKFFERDNNGEHVSLPIEVTHKDIIAYGIQNDVALRSYRITKKTWDSVFK